MVAVDDDGYPPTVAIDEEEGPSEVHVGLCEFTPVMSRPLRRGGGLTSMAIASGTLDGFFSVSWTM